MSMLLILVTAIVLRADPLVPQPVLPPVGPAASAAPLVPLPAAKLDGAKIFALASPAVFKLSTRLKSANASSSHGTAFAVREDGYLITNYHVVAQALIQPTKYVLDLQMPAGPAPAEVLAIDAVNDIALVKVKAHLPNVLKVSVGEPTSHGEQIFSLGFPKSEKLSIISGMFNGVEDFGFAAISMASMPLNPGMSGGPTLNLYGEVVGVNRAMLTSAQDISYMSPLNALTTMVAKAGRPSAPFDWKKTVHDQIRAQENLSYLNFARAPAIRQRIGELSFALPFRGMECGQDQLGRQNFKAKTGDQVMACHSVSLALLEPDLRALQISTVVLSGSSQWSPSNSFKYFEAHYAEASKFAREIQTSRAPASEKVVKANHKVDEKCGAKNIVNKLGVPLLVRYCRIGVEPGSDLYSTFLKVDFPSHQNLNTSIAQSYEGLSREMTAKMVELFLDSVQIEGKS